MELGQYQFSLTDVSDIQSLSSEWRSLEACAKQSFFLSWTWISNWLEVYSPRVQLLRVYAEEQLVGLCFLHRCNFSSYKRVSRSRLHMHQTGKPSQDQIWTEYNGLLCIKEKECEIYQQLLPFLVDQYPNWDEFQIGAITQRVADALTVNSSLDRLDLWHSPSYGVDLVKLRQSSIHYLDSLSRNTRYQINRSFKLYTETGELSLQFASSANEALEFFNEISPLHKLRWGDSPEQSGFSNPEFLRFHESLISKGFSLGQIDLIRVCCGERVLGYLYNFLYQGRVYFYLSGLIAEDDAKLKPGLCAHALAIQHYMDAGYDFYDFMGGNDRYKASLGCIHESLFQVSFQKPLLKFKIEAFLRRLKRYFES